MMRIHVGFVAHKTLIMKEARDSAPRSVFRIERMLLLLVLRLPLAHEVRSDNITSLAR